MPRDLGFSFGNRLEGYERGEAAVLADADEQIAVVKAAAANQKEIAELNLKAASARNEELEAVFQERQALTDELSHRRNISPRDFSLGRGVFFVAVGILLLVGDLTILSGVLTKILGLDGRATDGTNTMIVTEIVNRPFLALELFRNVIVLTFSVLLLGFFPKLFFDLPVEELPTTYRRTLKIVMIASVAAVVVTALARWGFDIKLASTPATTASTGGSGSAGSSSKWLFDISSVLLGLALPYVSCFFVSVGADRIGRRWDLWMASVASGRAARALGVSRENVKSITADVASRIADEAAASMIEHEQRVRSKVRAEYSQGYADGTVSLLSGSEPGAIFNALRLIAIRRKLS